MIFPRIIRVRKPVDPLPCPFCGHLPKIHPTNPKRDGTCWGEVCCENEACHAKPTVRDSARVNAECGSHAYKEIAIRHWNRRIKPLTP